MKTFGKSEKYMRMKFISLYSAKDLDYYSNVLERMNEYNFLDDNLDLVENVRSLLSKLFDPIVINKCINTQTKSFCFNGSCKDKYKNIFWFVVDEFNVYILHFSTPHDPYYIYDEDLTKKWRAIMLKTYKDVYYVNLHKALDDEINELKGEI